MVIPYKLFAVSAFSRRSLRHLSLFLPVLALFAAFLAARPASAQGCIGKGADLQPGLQYLESHARPESSRAVYSVASDPLAGKLIFNDAENARTTIDIASVDCSKTVAGTGWQGDNRMWIYCLDGRPCVQSETRASASDEWAAVGAPRTSASYVTESGDAASTAELSSTFSSVIYQLQQQFQTMHTGVQLPVPSEP